MNIKIGTGLLFVLRAIKSVISVIILALSARYFGIDVEMDAWVLVGTVITAISGVSWGPINEIFRAKFISIKEIKGEEMAMQMSLSLVTFVVLFSIIISSLLILLSPYIVSFFSANFTSEFKYIFIKLLIIIAPTLLLNEITALSISILNSYDVFYLPEIVSVITGLISLLVIILLANIFGIYTLVISQYVGVFLLFFISLYFLKKKGIILWSKKIKIKWEYIKPFLIFALPFVFTYFVSQINQIFESRYVNGYGQGYLSSLNYSKQSIAVLQPVLTSILMTMMVPHLTKEFVNRNFIEFKKKFVQYFDVCIIIAGSIIPILYGASDTICSILFKSKVINIEFQHIITNLFKLYSLSLVGITMYLLLGMTLISVNLSKKYAFIGILMQIIILSLYIILHNHYQIYLFPIVFGVLHITAGLCMVIFIPKYLKKLILIKFISLLVITTCFSFISFFLNLYFSEYNLIVKIVINIIAFLIFLLAILFNSNKSFIKIKELI